MDHQPLTPANQSGQQLEALSQPTASIQSPPRRHPLRRLQRGAGNQAAQRLVQAKLAVNPPGDPYEEEADRVADLVLGQRGAVRPQPPAITPIAAAPVRRCACGGLIGPDGECETCRRKRLALQGKGLDDSPHPAALAQVEDALARGGGRPLDPPLRHQFEAQFDQDFSGVRIHTNGRAASTAQTLRARAYTAGQDIVFAPGEYAPETAVGQHLLAHELTHTIQQTQGAAAIQRQPVPSPADVLAQSGQSLMDAIRQDNLPGVVSALTGRSVDDMRYLMTNVKQQIGIGLVQWVVARAHQTSARQTAVSWATTLLPLVPGGTAVAPAVQLLNRGGTSNAAAAEQALRLLWPAMSLLDRLEFYKDAFREIEAAQLDVIRAASAAERQAALAEPDRLNAIYQKMSAKEEYDGRLLIQPDKRYDATVQLISRAKGTFSDDEDPVFDAILNLTPAERQQIWQTQLSLLNSMLSESQISLIRLMTLGSEDKNIRSDNRSTEAQALMARLRLATEGRTDDKEGIQTVLKRASELLQEKRQLQAQQSDTTLTTEARTRLTTRLQEFGDLEALFKIAPTGEAGRDKSFMGRLEDAAGSPQEFGKWAQQVSADPFEAAKRQILLADGTFSIDNVAIETAVLNLRAPTVTLPPGTSDADRETRQTQANNELRQRLLADPEVKAVLEKLSHAGPAGKMYVSSIQDLAQGDRFVELLHDFSDAVEQANYGEVFRLTLVFARRPDWKTRFQATANSALNALPRLPQEQRQIVDTILQTGEMPVDKLLTFAGRAGTMGSVEMLRAALGQLSEQQRGQLRLGYTLSRQHPNPATLTQEAKTALEKFNAFESQLRQSLSTIRLVDERGVQDVLDAALGSVPTESEMSTGAGRMRAAALLYERQKERLALRRGMVTPFTETDETMEAAAREFAALWERVRHQGELSATDFAALSALHERFEGRTQEFTEANEMISEMASMVAATVAATIVVVATGGTATPAVLAAAAATGAGTRLLTREMFGGDYFDPTSAEGARTALLAAIDGALAVVGASLAARGVELLGLSGEALTAGAARLGAQAAEQGSQSLGRRMAVGAVEAALDGAFSGSISEAASTMTDARTWRRGVWQGLVSVGQAAIVGGLTGLGTGAAIGAMMPAAGAGAKRVRDAVARNSVDRVLEKVGAEATHTLDAARRAARAGNQDEARRLFNQLEEHLTPEQTRVLRAELSLDVHAPVRPPEATEPPNQRQTKLLEESRAVSSGNQLTQEQLDNEIAMVRRSQTRPATELGYVDEVDLGNEHIWRRKADDGTWCRFSQKSLCGTVIEGAPRPARPRFDKDVPPANYEVRQMTYDKLPRDQAGNFEPLPGGVVYEFPGGHRIWRQGDTILHDSAIGAGHGRLDFEGQKFTAGESGLPELQGMHRAHTLGQGTGFESPFGIYYAPAEVNLLIQNNGIEEFMRGLHEALPPGEKLHVVTRTKAHPDSLRLKQIRYQVEVDVGGGRREFLFEYVIDVGNDVPNPTVTHGIGLTTENPDLARYLDPREVDVPARLRDAWARRGAGATPVPRVMTAQNLNDVLPVVGQPVATTNVPTGYVKYQMSDGAWRIRRLQDNDQLFEALTVDANNLIQLRTPL